VPPRQAGEPGGRSKRGTPKGCQRATQPAALGAGEALNAEPLATRSGMVRNVVRALDLAADTMAEGRPVPAEAVALMAKPMMPAWVYTLAGNWGWKRRAAQ